MDPVVLARTVRSGMEESVHAGDVVVVDSGGRLVASAGDPDRALFARSAMKPLQATVALSLAALTFSDKEVAVMAASHNAEWVHLQAVRTILARAGLEETDLQCPAVRPWDETRLEEDPTRRRINSDCSGKHAGMLAACRSQEWSLESYREPDHPLQQEILRTVRLITGLDDVPVGVDGCGVPVHALPLRGMARIYGSFSAPEDWGELRSPVRRVLDAMQAEPHLVAGRDRIDTALMECIPALVAKGGAEGLLCASALDRGLAVAVRVRDGGHRAAGPAMIRTLAQLDIVDAAQLEALRRYASPPVFGGEAEVGRVETDFQLARA